MKEEIIDLILVLATDNYDREKVHLQYDQLLEKFILNYEARLAPLMRKLIKMPKNFYYA